eukprot:11579742-Heterocapsa_arctica.AAC.1
MGAVPHRRLVYNSEPIMGAVPHSYIVPVVHGCYRMPCALIPDNALYISFRAAVSSVLPPRTTDVFPLASALVFARRRGRSGFAFIIASV